MALDACVSLISLMFFRLSTISFLFLLSAALLQIRVVSKVVFASLWLIVLLILFALVAMSRFGDMTALLFLWFSFGLVEVS